MRFQGIAPGEGGRRGSAGFTLLELVIAAGLLSIGALVVYPTLFTFQEWSRAAHEENLALYDLEAAVERLRGMPVADILTYYPPPGSPSARPAPARTVYVVPLPEYDDLHLRGERVELEYYNPTEDPVVYTLRVAWRDFLRRDRERLFTTAVAR